MVQENVLIALVGAVAASAATSTNTQEGDNRATLSQAAPASTGDGVAGEVIGAVTSAGGSSSIVAANTSDRVDVTTGDADSTNDAAVFVGLNAVATSAAVATEGGFQLNLVVCPAGTCTAEQLNVAVVAPFFADFAADDRSNVQEGDNRLSGAQTASASTGDGVAGQVIGAVSAGATSIDATNRSVDSDVETGDADAANSVTAFVGLNVSDEAGGGIFAADLSGVSGDNVQEGDNALRFGQTAEALSGDAVAGQVSGVVTSAGGSASVVLANLSEGIDVESGEGDFANTEAFLVGLNVSTTTVIG